MVTQIDFLNLNGRTFIAFGDLLAWLRKEALEPDLPEDHRELIARVANVIEAAKPKSI